MSTSSPLEKALEDVPDLPSQCQRDMGVIKELLLGQIGTANQRSAVIRIIVQLRPSQVLMPKILREINDGGEFILPHCYVTPPTRASNVEDISYNP